MATFAAVFLVLRAMMECPSRCIFGVAVGVSCRIRAEGLPGGRMSGLTPRMQAQYEFNDVLVQQKPQASCCFVVSPTPFFDQDVPVKLCGVAVCLVSPRTGFGEMRPRCHALRNSTVAVCNGIVTLNRREKIYC